MIDPLHSDCEPYVGAVANRWISHAKKPHKKTSCRKAKTAAPMRPTEYSPLGIKDIPMRQRRWNKQIAWKRVIVRLEVAMMPVRNSPNPVMPNEERKDLESSSELRTVVKTGPQRARM